MDKIASLFKLLRRSSILIENELVSCVGFFMFLVLVSGRTASYRILQTSDTSAFQFRKVLRDASRSLIRLRLQKIFASHVSNVQYLRMFVSNIPKQTSFSKYRILTMLIHVARSAQLKATVLPGIMN